MYEMIQFPGCNLDSIQVSALDAQASFSALTDSTEDLIDITDQKRMRAALRKSDEKFAKAFSESPIITTISDFNDDDRLIEVNQAFEAVVGYTRQEAIGRTSRDLQLWNDPKEFHEAVRLYRKNGSLRGFEYRFRTKAGEVRTGLISAAVT